MTAASAPALRSGTDYRVIALDDDHSLLFLTGNHRTFHIGRELGDRLDGGFDRLSPEEAAEWERLCAAGLAVDTNRGVLASSGFQDGADLAINVNLTNLCNLSCTYCFAEGGDYGRIKSAMGPESVEDIFRFIERHVTPSRSVRFEFFGGEPLANFKTIREICERSLRVAERTGTRFVYRISSNLTLMPEGVLDLFARHRFIVSVSIDGGRTVQDANRPTKSGAGSFDRIIANVQRVRAASDDIVLVARMTVAQRSPTLLDNVRELWALDVFDYFQIYPAVAPADSVNAVPISIGRKGEPAPPPSTAYVNFFLQEGMTEQFREFLAAYPSLFHPANRFKGVLEYERTVQMALEGMLALAFCSGGRTYFTHSPDRSISPCHRLVGDQSFDVGAGPDGLAREPDEWRLPVDVHPVCSGCWARYVCGGGCRQENFVATGSIHELNSESCRYQLLLAEEVLRMMGRSSEDYRRRDRAQLDDLFVSCGRPVLDNGRPRTGTDDRPWSHFVPIADPPLPAARRAPR